MPQPRIDAAIREHQNHEVIKRLVGFLLFCFVLFFHMKPFLDSARRVFLTKDFQVESKNCFPVHFDLLPLKSSPCHSQFYQGEERKKKKERIKKPCTDWGRERERGRL